MSKYDNFWTRIQGELEAAIQKSLQTGSETTLILTGLTDQGNRFTWYAKGIIGADNPDNMSHGTALANCLMTYARENRLIVDYVVAKDGREVQLTARRTAALPIHQPAHPRPVQVILQTVCEKPYPPQVTMVTENSPSQNQKTRTMKILEGRTLIILPCCKSKNANIPHPAPLPSVPKEYEIVRSQIKEPRPCVIVGKRQAPALWLYTGSLYNQLDKKVLHEEMAKGWLDIVILSGGYGMAHAYEMIHEYEAIMPTYYKDWIKAGLPKALKTYIETTKPDNIIAFFANNTNSPQARQKESYGGMYCLGSDGIKVRGVLGKYVAIKMPGAGTANAKLGRLVMEVVQTRTLIQRDDIPFRPPCWPWN